ncbi:MAG: pyridoxamine 5'-phosphate oxidase family protein [Candidatus Riflebacteria bacterium]|nr:pyridoxamine 5'-phosphate oxidase family protein [Candidatus Riflebacteria bacterium]
MRRKDKEISDWKDIEALLESECILHLAMIDQKEPYLVALNYGFEGKALYFHSSREGRKMEIMSRPQCGRVCFMVDRFQGVLERKTDSPVPSFTTRFKSVIGWGHITRETNLEAIRHGLNTIIFQSTRKVTNYSFAGCQEKIELLRLDIDTVSGKQSTID